MRIIKNHFKFSIIFILLLLVGCSTQSTTTKENNDEEIMKPPTLLIQIGDETIIPTLGTYSWSEPVGEGMRRIIHADAFAAPPDLVKNSLPTKVNKSEIVKMDFEVSPQEYEIREWDSKENDVANVFKELDLTEHTGIKVFEVLVHWEQGTASFAFLLEIE